MFEAVICSAYAAKCPGDTKIRLALAMSACLVSNSRDATLQNGPKASELRIKVPRNQTMVETSLDQCVRGIARTEWPFPSGAYDFHRALECL